jgi:phospholipid/cholesterol/gamma-HCH transport system substrate-binding protein
MSDKAAVLAPPSRGRNQELWVGLFVILGGAITLFLLFTLTDAALFRGRYIISSVVPNAGGVRKGDPVQMLGVNIGRVKGFTIAPTGVEISLEIEGEYGIPTDSSMELKSAGPLGGMIANVFPGRSPQMVRGGGVLRGELQPDMMAEINKVSGEANKTMARVQLLLSDSLIKNTDASMLELNTLLKRMTSIANEQQKELKTLTGSMKVASDNLAKATSREEIDRAMKSLEKTSASAERASAMMEKTTNSLNVVLGRIERGEGTLGKMSTNDDLYTNLNKTLESVNATSLEMKNLMADLKANPKKYLKVSVF